VKLKAFKKVKNTFSGREIFGRLVFQESKASNEKNFKTGQLCLL